jgi:hypothetical protein
MRKPTAILIGAVALFLAGFVLTHLGDYPQIMTTWWYTALAIFVGLNTIGFAVYAALKLGYQSGRSAVNSRGQNPTTQPTR